MTGTNSMFTEAEFSDVGICASHTLHDFPSNSFPNKSHKSHFIERLWSVTAAYLQKASPLSWLWPPTEEQAIGSGEKGSEVIG